MSVALANESATHVAVDLGLDQPMVLAFQLARQVDAFASQLSLDGIELPPVVGTAADQARVRATAPLYLASELESAALIPAVETLAGLFRTGTLPINDPEALNLLHRFWQTRRERFTATERQAVFARLFGNRPGSHLSGPGINGGSNDGFEQLLLNLTEALHQMQPHPVFGTASGPHEHVRVRTAARLLAENLSSLGGGITPFASRDILATIRQSIDILKQRSVQQALGTRSVWSAVRRIAQRYLQQPVDINNHVTRGKSGLTMLAWVAELVPQLESSNRLVLPDGLVSAATAWLQSTFALAQARGGQSHVR